MTINWIKNNVGIQRVWFALKKFPSSLYSLSLFCILIILILGHLDLNNDDNFKWKIVADLSNATFAGIVFYFLTVHWPQIQKKEKFATILNNLCSYMRIEVDEFL